MAVVGAPALSPHRLPQERRGTPGPGRRDHQLQAPKGTRSLPQPPAAPHRRGQVLKGFSLTAWLLALLLLKIHNFEPNTLWFLPRGALKPLLCGALKLHEINKELCRH